MALLFLFYHNTHCHCTFESLFFNLYYYFSLTVSCIQFRNHSFYMKISNKIGHEQCCGL